MEMFRRIAVVVSAFGLESSAVAVVEPSRLALTNIDLRQKEITRPAPAEKRHAAAKLRERIPQVQIEFEEITGSPKRISTTRGLLTGPNGIGRAVSEDSIRGFGIDDPHRVTKAFLKEHKPLFGYGPEVLEKAHVKREHTAPHNGLRTVVWEQQLDGIAVFEAVLMSHTTRQGELVSISSQFVPDVTSAANKGHRNKARQRNEPTLSAAEAILKAAMNVGEQLLLTDIEAQGSIEGTERQQKFKAKNLSGDTGAKLLWLPMSAAEMRLCWEVILTSRFRGEMFRILIDGESGEALLRHCLTEYISNATYRVFTSDSPSPFSPAHPAPSSLQPPVVARQLVTLSALSSNASPNGWINDGINETRGNNVDAYSDRNSDDEADLPRPQGVPFRVFDFGLNLAEHPTNYTKAAVVQLFYWCNWMHDRLYELGFTEAAGNFQINNFGHGGEGNDPLKAEAQDGEFFSNANFATPPDGLPPRMQMAIWTEPYPDRDSDLDAEVILHEYTHGLSNRRVGGGVGIGALSTRGMGEGWSDFYALALLSQPGDDVDGTYPLAGYSGHLLGHAENYYYGIRRYPYCTDTNKNPLTFKDIDPTQISAHPGVPRNPRSAFDTNQASQVHAQGEVWCNTLWEIRVNLIRKHGHAIGNQLTLQLVSDSMTLCPPNPNFLQSRDAIIQADFVNNGGANFREIWAGFAKRGMGFGAVCPPSTDTIGVREAFDLPDDLWATPRTDWIAKGNIGGPFEPGTRSFRLENLGADTINWSAFATVGWLTLSNASGTLTTGSPPALVQASINTMANLLSAGTHTAEIVFTDQSNGRSQTNAVTLRIGEMDFLTERFDLRDNDLGYQSITFTPDGSPAFYSVCRAPATKFPIDPSGSIPFSTNAWSERSREATLSAGHSIALFGMRTNSFLLVFDGSISFFSSGSAEGSLSSHFEEPRISCLRATYAFEHSGRSWKELNDRVVVTFQNVPTFTVADRNNFQMELFYDGRIRFTYLTVDIRTGVVGLSRGNGIPPGFIESDFTAYPICMPSLALRVPTNATENAGTLTATVSRALPDATALVVNFGVSGPAEISAPASVLIPAGQTEASFQITIIDDPEPDGPQAPMLTASAPGFASANAIIFVSDNEVGSLAVHLPALATEGEIVQGIVALPAPTAKNIFVPLHSTDISEALLPAFTIIPAGATSAVFNVTIVDDSLIDGPQPVTIVAQVGGWPAASANILVQDNESLALSLAMRTQISEAVASIDGGGMVSIPGQLNSNLLVTLETSDTSELQVPSTVFILAGQTSAVFNLTAINDAAVDGAQTVTVSAEAAGFTGAKASVVVHDDEMAAEPFGPSPAHLAINQPRSLMLSWKSGLENRLSNGDFESGTFAGWTREFSAPSDADQRGIPAVRLAIDDGTYDPTEDDFFEGPGPSPPYAGFYSAFMSINSCFSGWGRFFQDITLPANASSATLSWVDRIVNPRLPYSPTQYFAVEIWSTNDVLREVLFTTPGGFPETNHWMPRSYSLSRYLGETVRLVWKQEYHCYLILTYLDNIALQVTSAMPTSFDVYLGTNPNPGITEFRGNTPNATWNLTNLEPDTVYFWRIVANRGGSQTAGPVWQFRTRPLIDRLQWSAIATQQYVGQPISVMLTAKGQSNQTLAEFNAPVSLSGTALTGGRTLFQDNFEDGNSTGWAVERSRPGPYNQQVTTNAAVGRYSFTLIGGNQKHVDGYFYVFPRFSMRPDQINFSVRSSATNQAGGFLAVGNDGGNNGVGVRFYMGASGRMGLLDRSAGLQGTNYVANRWYRISIVFDWTRRRVHCFADGQQIAWNVPFRVAFLDDVASLHLYNFDNTQAWWDEIEIIDGSRTIPIVISPSTTSDFANGVWFSNMTVSEPAANMWLTAAAANGQSSASGSFSVDPSTDLDGDGLPDAWEVRHFASTNPGAGADPDADGLTNLQEYRAGTNPNNASSTLRISSVEITNAAFRLRFESVAGKAYQLEHTGTLSLESWRPVGSLLLGTGQAIQIGDPIKTTNQFYRVRVMP